MRNFLILFLVFLIAIGVVHSATYYVNPLIGDDTNDGLTTGSAFKTIAFANSVAQNSGDEIRYGNCNVSSPGYNPLYRTPLDDYIRTQSGDATGNITLDGSCSLIYGSLNLTNSTWNQINDYLWFIGNYSTNNIELLPNPDFTVDLRNWSSYIDFGGAGAVGSLNNDTINYTTAPNSLNISVVNSGLSSANNFQVYTSKIALEKNAYYRLKFSITSNNTFYLTTSRITFINLSSPYNQLTTSQTSHNITVNGSWNEYSIYYKSGYNTTIGRLGFYFGKIVPDNTQINLDNVSLQKVNESVVDNDVGNMFFNGSLYGHKKQYLSNLTTDLDFTYNSSSWTVYLNSSSNPKTRFGFFEAGLDQTIIVTSNKDSYIVIKNFNMAYTGRGCIDINCANHIYIMDNKCSNGGGSYQYATTNPPVRYGNGIDVNLNSSYIEVLNNNITNYYDSGFTIESWASAGPTVMSNILVKNNIFAYAHSAVEIFSNNLSTDPTSALINISIIKNTIISGNEFSHYQRPNFGFDGFRMGTIPYNTTNLNVTDNIIVGVGPENFSSRIGDYPNSLKGIPTLDYNSHWVNSTSQIPRIQWNFTVNYSSLAAFKADLPDQEIHGVEINPMFFDFKNGDYRPSWDSFACNMSSDGSYVGALDCIHGSTPHFPFNPINNTINIVGVCNYSHPYNLSENGSYGWYIINGVKNGTYNFSNQRTIWSGYQGFNTTFFAIVTNHDGTRPFLNCTDVKESCAVSLGHNTSFGGTSIYNNSLYYIYLRNIYGDAQNLTDYLNTSDGYLTMWIYIENVSVFDGTSGDYAIDFYFTANTTDWQYGWNYEIQASELKSGWNFYYKNLSMYEAAGGEASKNTSGIKTFSIEFMDSYADPDIINKINVSAGWWRVSDIKVGNGIPVIPRYITDLGDLINISCVVCRGADCDDERNSSSLPVSKSNPYFVYDNYMTHYNTGEVTVKDHLYRNTVAYCDSGDTFDEDGLSASSNFYLWFVNGTEIIGQNQQGINLDAFSVKAGDNVSCAARPVVAYANGTLFNGSYFFSQNKTILDIPQIIINASKVMNTVSEFIFGQGNTLVAQDIGDTAFNATTRTFDAERLGPASSIGFKSTRWGGCDANWYIWGLCSAYNQSGYWGKPCSGGWTFYNCSQERDEPKVLLDDIINYSVQIGAKRIVMTTQTVNNGSPTEPSSHVAGNYSASFINYTNNVMGWNITWWEIGNEVWSSSQYGDTASYSRYAQEFSSHCASLKSIDPNAKCGLVVHAYPEVSWNYYLMKLVGNISDFLVIHPYEGSNIPYFTSFSTYKDYNFYVPQDANYIFGGYGMVNGSNLSITVYDSADNVNSYSLFEGFSYSANGDDYISFETDNVFLKRGKHKIRYDVIKSKTFYLGDPYWKQNPISNTPIANLSVYDKIIFYCDFDNGQNCTSRNGNGTPIYRTSPNDGVSNQTGYFNNAVLINKSSNYLLYNATNNFNFSGITIMMWINDQKVDGTTMYNDSKEHYLFHFGKSWEINTTSLEKGTGTGNSMTFRTGNEAGYAGGGMKGVSFTMNTSSGVVAKEGTWYHVAAGFNCNEMKIWLDGVLKDTETLSACPIIDYNNSITNFSIGSMRPGDYSANVTIDEFIIFNGLLTTDEVQPFSNSKRVVFNASNYTYYVNMWKMVDADIGQNIYNLTRTMNVTMNKTVPLFATEWLCHPGTNQYPGWGNEYTRFWGCDGLANAGVLQGFIKNDSVQEADAWILSSGSSRTPSTYYYYDTNVYTAQYYTFQLFSNHTGNKRVDSVVKNVLNLSKTRYSETLYSDLLTVVTTLSSDNQKMFLNVINKNEVNITPIINISGFSFDDNITVYELKGDWYDSRNIYNESIFTVKKTINKSGVFNYTFSPLSITVLEFNSAGCPDPAYNENWVMTGTCSYENQKINIGTGRLMCNGCNITLINSNLSAQKTILWNHGRIILYPESKLDRQV